MRALLTITVVMVMLSGCRGGQCGHKKGNPTSIEQSYAVDWRDSNDHRGAQVLSSREPIRIKTVKLPASCQPEGCYCTFENETISTFTDLGTTLCRPTDIVTDKVRAFLEDVIDSAVEFLQRALKIDRVVGNLKVNEGVCGFSSGGSSRGVLVDDGTEYPNTDFVVYLTAVPAEGLTQAWAVGCQSDQSGRPTAAVINFAPAAFPLANIEAHPLVLQNARRTAIHELIHALGYSDDYYGSGWYFHTGWFNTTAGPPTVKIVGVDRKPVDIMRTPKVVEKAREHFDCPLLTGVELENQGGNGTSFSHWEKRILGPETMTGVQTAELSTISSITLAYFEDTGVYDVDYSVAEDLLWGYKKGCDFLMKKCNETDFEEFCFPKKVEFEDLEDSCSITRLGYGVCDVLDSPVPIPPEYQYFPNHPLVGSGAVLSDYCPFHVPVTRCTDAHSQELGCPDHNANSCDADKACSYNNVTGICTAVQTTILGQSFGDSSRCFKSQLARKGWSVVHNSQARCFTTLCSTDGLSYNIVTDGGIKLYCNDTTTKAIIPQELFDNFDSAEVTCAPVHQVCGVKGIETTSIQPSDVVIPIPASKDVGKEATKLKPDYQMVIMIAGGCLVAVCLGICLANKVCGNTSDQAAREQLRRQGGAQLLGSPVAKSPRAKSPTKRHNQHYEPPPDQFIQLAVIADDRPLE
eukprot:TRINITY_DN19045_c0_g1_i2.p1 TRINITY_DN19045_c0_g1~~TRINITY_DN19045_c0_g1_i2.p1  ORF type:complete len:702 (+),score=90.08 TRINITY_DN19045_c0_g1_i2:37-2106(+)